MLQKELPYFEVGVSAGFPSPADDEIERPLDLHDLLVKHPSATFFIRVDGDSMEGAGIYTGDILVVDRALKAEHGTVVVALFNGEFTVKRLHIVQKKIYLFP